MAIIFSPLDQSQPVYFREMFLDHYCTPYLQQIWYFRYYHCNLRRWHHLFCLDYSLTVSDLQAYCTTIPKWSFTTYYWSITVYNKWHVASRLETSYSGTNYQNAMHQTWKVRRHPNSSTLGAFEYLKNTVSSFSPKLYRLSLFKL